MDIATAEIGYDIPARPGDPVSAIATPALIVDLDAFESNLARMKAFLDRTGLRLRAHAKTHKSADIARLQMGCGGACGICCQKISEAEALVRAGINDVLISNQIVGPARARRLARLAKQTKLMVCVDHKEQVDQIAQAAQTEDVVIGTLVEIECGGGRCGVRPGGDAVALAQAIAQSPGLYFAGLQAYQGSLQHEADFEKRRARAIEAADLMRMTISALARAGLDCQVVGGAGTGSFQIDAELGVINELQCGSYIFMDADYDRIREADGGRPGGMTNALFVLTEIMSQPQSGRSVCDAGLKALAVDSGLPRVLDTDLRYLGASDEHGIIEDPAKRLRLGDKLRLIPGHCDPTSNLYDWFVCIRSNHVESLWPITARGKLY